METGKIKEFIMNDKVFTVCLTLAIITLIGSVTFYKYSELKSIQSNVESAIVKGIDPVAVRCAYANERDVVCVAYGSGHVSPQVTTKK
jgi:uncharacterized membrane protein